MPRDPGMSGVFRDAPARIRAALRAAGQGRGPGGLPPMLGGGRRRLFLRLVLNGSVQAAAAVALVFVIGGGTGLGLAPMAGLLALLAAALMGLRVLELSDAERLGLDYVAETRLRLFDGLATGRARTAHGIAMTRLMNDLAALRNWVGLGLARSITAALALAGCLVAAVTISWPATLALLVPLVAVAAAATALTGPLLRRTGAVRDARGRLARLLGEALLALEMLVAFGQTRRMRRRVAAASTDLTARLQDRIRIAAMLRALPDAVLPGAVIAALGLGMAPAVEAVGLVLLAGIATGPVRQALRALEYRAAFLVGEERLSGALAPAGDGAPRRRKRAATGPGPGLVLHAGPPPARGAVTVSAEAPILRGSLRRNIDITRALRGDDTRLAAIAAACGLLDPALAPKGLETRLDPDRTALDEAARARLSLARALAAGAGAVRILAPSLVISAEGRALIEGLTDRFGLHVAVETGDAAGLFARGERPRDAA